MSKSCQGCEADRKIMGAQEEVVMDFTGCELEEKTMERDFAFSRVQSQTTERCSSYSLHKLEFAKKLGSEGRKMREMAIDLLKSWLTAQESVAEEDLTKIWKGLFYCLQHADKRPLIQVDLAENFASLVQNLELKLSQQYFKAFLLTLRQERSGIDNLQLDKLYLLLKQFLRHIFIVLRNNAWHPALIKGFMDDLTEQAFLAIGVFPVQQEISFCIADIYLNELEDFLPLEIETFVLLVEPFFTVLAKASNQCLLIRIKHNVFERLLESGRNLINLKQEGKYVDDRVGKLGSIVLTMGTTSRLLKMATFSSTLQENRRILYELHDEFSELDRLLVISGISDESSESSKLEIQDSLDAAVSGQVQQLDIVDNREDGSPNRVKKNLGKNGKPRNAKTIPKEVDGSNEEKIKAKGSSELHIKKLECNVWTHIVEEATTNNTGLNQDATKEEHISDHRSHDDSVELGDSVISDLEREFEKVATGDSLISDLEQEFENVATGDSVISDLEREFEKVATGDSVISDLEQEFENVATGDSVISDLEREFEKGARELEDYSSPLPSLVFSVSPLSSGSQKRKRVMSVGKAITADLSALDDHENEENASAIFTQERISAKKKTGDKSVKKVTFSLKHNLIWKPSSPLPPYSLRVPSSARPRGSALKKGVPPGPICIIKESPSPKKIISKKRCVMGRRSSKHSKGFSSRPQLRGKKQGDSLDICNAAV